VLMVQSKLKKLPVVSIRGRSPLGLLMSPAVEQEALIRLTESIVRRFNRRLVWRTYPLGLIMSLAVEQALYGRGERIWPSARRLR
jgi:hypothetical protein